MICSVESWLWLNARALPAGFRQAGGWPQASAPRAGWSCASKRRSHQGDHPGRRGSITGNAAQQYRLLRCHHALDDTIQQVLRFIGQIPTLQGGQRFTRTRWSQTVTRA